MVYYHQNLMIITVEYERFYVWRNFHEKWCSAMALFSYVFLIICYYDTKFKKLHFWALSLKPMDPRAVYQKNSEEISTNLFRDAAAAPQPIMVVDNEGKKDEITWFRRLSPDQKTSSRFSLPDWLRRSKGIYCYTYNVVTLNLVTVVHGFSPIFSWLMHRD